MNNKVIEAYEAKYCDPHVVRRESKAQRRAKQEKAAKKAKRLA